jgi:hypothetical protein
MTAESPPRGNNLTITRDADVTAALDRFRAALAAQIATGWPPVLSLPRPSSPAEHLAFALFIDALFDVPSGVRITFES